ncbi:MAG: M48 family metallopeptidase [Gemmatimonadaceae bacterium]
MAEMIRFGDITIAVTHKDIKHVHLSVHPPTGRVTLVAPNDTRPEVARAYAASRLGWIRNHRAKFHSQARETPREFVTRETHYVWGKRRLLYVLQRDTKPCVTMDQRRITLTVRPQATRAKRAAVMHDWHKGLLHAAVPPLLRKWQRQLSVEVNGYCIQRMKTKWGSCNHKAKRIRLNTELVKKPKDLLEYVVVHEMVHLLEPTHNERFVALMNGHYPTWREARAELNELPLAPEAWAP